MAWTTMTTKAAAAIPTEVDWNHIVNNFAETAPAKAATAGRLIRVTGTNAVEEADPEDGAKLDGDHLDIDFTPTNYTPDSSPAEAADVDDLAAHLKGIDNELAIVGAGMAGASDDLVQSADTERSGTDTTYTLKKEIVIINPGTYRIAFDMYCNGTSSSFGQIYRNGSPVGTERLDGDHAYSTYTEDISGWSTNDLCQLFMKQSGSDTYFCRNFRVSGHMVPTPGAVNTD